MRNIPAKEPCGEETFKAKTRDTNVRTLAAEQEDDRKGESRSILDETVLLHNK